jgi:hypothetical protein
VPLNEARDCSKDVLVCHDEVVNEIQENMVAVCISMLGGYDFKSIENARDKTIGLRYQVLCGAHRATEPTGAYKSANEEAAVQLVFLGNSVIDVNLLRLYENRFEIVLGKSAEFELEGEGGFDVSECLLFGPLSLRTAESEVDGILTETADEERDAAHASLGKSLAMLVRECDELFRPSILGHVVGVVEDT